MRNARTLLALALGVVACGATPGACSLPALRGRVVDRDDGRPIAAAIAIEWWHRSGWMGEPARASHVRWVASDAEGRFAFDSARAPLGSRGPSYGFVHPDYGLVRAGEAASGEAELVLRGSRADVAARQALAALCESAPREDWERELRPLVCARH